ncbi:MAG TPA: Gfo/Idh/MocA family oxidoreductase [Ktedonobacteraceae bacterium]|jgi:predicted dehydrogenase
MRIKVAVVGAGNMGMNHLRVLHELGEHQVLLVAVAEMLPALLQRAMQRFHIPGYLDYRQMVEETCPDLVAVVVPTQYHFSVASTLLQRGLHVLVEKPMATTLEEALTLNQLARMHGVKLAVGHVERFNPAIIELKRRLLNNELGQLFSLHARRLGPFPPRIRDVGVTLDLATHDVDVMRYLNDAEVRYVYAESQRRVHTTHEDLVFGILRFANDVIGMLDSNWLTPTKVRELTVTGERGMFLVNYLTQDVFFYENDYSPPAWNELSRLTGVSEGTMTRLQIRKAEPLRLEYEDLIRALQTDSLPTVTGEDGLAVLQVAHQLIASTQREVVDNLRLQDRISYQDSL